MHTEIFINYIKTLGKISDHDISKIKQKIVFQKAKKKENLVSPHQVCDKVFFVIKGMLRTYYIDKKGIEKTRLISVENEFCSNWKSFHNLSTNNEFIESLESCELIYIRHTDFYELINNSDVLKLIYTVVLEKFQSYHISRFELLSMTLTERLRSVYILFPKLRNRLSNKVLASFLHTTPEHCSSIKKSIL